MIPPAPHDLLDCSPGSRVVTLTTSIKLPLSVSALLCSTDHPNAPPGQTIVKPPELPNCSQYFRATGWTSPANNVC